MEIALLIEWTPHNGKRAGNINPKDPKLQCYGWQNMEVEPALELRLVEDDRDLTQYETIAGVQIIEGKSQINEIIDQHFKDRYFINDKFVFEEHFKQRNKKSETAINIDELPDQMQDRLKTLHNLKIKGIAIKKPIKL